MSKADIERLEKLLCQCRDAFPMPAEGSNLELLWLDAVGSPDCIPTYLRAVASSLNVDKRANKASTASSELASQLHSSDIKSELPGLDELFPGGLPDLPFIVCGPMKSGKSTTLSAMMSGTSVHHEEVRMTQHNDRPKS